MKIYNVFHICETDGGFGDAIPQMELMASFVNKADAEAFVKKYNHPYVYDTPYDELHCNGYEYVETELITHEEFNINKAPNEYDIFVPHPMETETDDIPSSTTGDYSPSNPWNASGMSVSDFI